MVKKIWNRIGLFFIILSICMVIADPVLAKNKTAYYSFMTTSLSGYNIYNDASKYGQVYYARIKKNRLILKGTLERHPSQNAMYNGPWRHRALGEKKRVFKVNKNTKYYATEKESIGKMYVDCRVSKKIFNRYLKELYGMGVYVKVKNGKVIYMEMRN